MISVLVPYAAAGPERLLTWNWLFQRWRTMTDVEIVIGTPDTVGDPALFCRAQALNRAADRSYGDVLVLADADTAFDPVQLRFACQLVADEKAPWVLPGRYVRLSAAVTAAWVAENPSAPPPALWEAGIDEEWPDNVSGIVVLPRAAYEAVGGFDERFKGWGWEDGSFACALNTLYGQYVRQDGHVAWHLWHPRPPQDSVFGPYAVTQQRLGQRYLNAAGNKRAMRALIGEQ